MVGKESLKEEREYRSLYRHEQDSRKNAVPAGLAPHDTSKPDPGGIKVADLMTFDNTALLKPEAAKGQICVTIML